MSGDHLDQLAKLVAESNKAIWKDKMATDKAESQYLDKISEFLNK